MTELHIGYLTTQKLNQLLDSNQDISITCSCNGTSEKIKLSREDIIKLSEQGYFTIDLDNVDSITLNYHDGYEE